MNKSPDLKIVTLELIRVPESHLSRELYLEVTHQGRDCSRSKVSCLFVDVVLLSGLAPLMSGEFY